MEERDYTWSPEIELDLVMDNVRAAVFGDIPAFVTHADGRRASKGSDISKIQKELARAIEESDGYNMVGYSMVFNQWTRINDQDGEYWERVMPGAPAKSIRERGDRIIVQFDHGHHPLVGSIPVAAPRAVWEDEHGLFAWDRMHKSWLFEPVREAVQSGAIRGQSFRFSVPPGGDVWEKPGRDGLRRRSLIETSVAERGPVVWPAYAGTEIAVRALVRAMPEDLRRAVSSFRDDDCSAAERDNLESDSTGDPAAHVGTGELAADRNGPALGVTRHELRRMASGVLVGVNPHHVQASGDAA